ncbi:MarR family winged helix-turn-helix transcriptional regulator [Halovulum marinum]|nr:MarR family transcriptional regulator [Halovulum marinum]
MKTQIDSQFLDAAPVATAQNRRDTEALLHERRDTWPEAASTPSDALLRLVRLAEGLQSRVRAQARARFDLAAGDYDLLIRLRSEPAPHAMTPTALCRSLNITPGGLTKIMHRLKARGLIERAPSPTDGRSALTRLTEAGLEMAEAALASAQAPVEALLSDSLGGSELDQLDALLRKALLTVESAG